MMLPILLWALFSSSFCSEISSSPLVFNKFHHHEKRVEDSSLSKRATPSEFSVFHERMTLTARVLAGISLQLALEDGSLHEDIAILELLKLDESLRLNDVESFDRGKLDSFFGQLQNVNVTGDADLDNLDKSILMMSTLLESFELVGDVTNGTNMYSILNEINRFSTTQFDVSLITELKSNITNSIADISTFKNMQIATISDVTLLVGIKKKIEELSTVENSIRNFFNLLNGSVYLIASNLMKWTPQFRYIHFIEEFNNGKAAIQNSTALDKLEVLLIKLEALKPSNSDLNTIIKLLMPDHNSPSGFFNGYPDLGRIPLDLSDKWVKKAIPGFNPKKVARSLNPLAPLNANFLALDLQWKPLRTDANLKEIQKLIRIRNHFYNLRGNITNHLNELSPLLDTPDSQVDTSKAMPVFKDCDILGMQMRRLVVAVSRLIHWEQLSNLQNLAEKFNRSIPFSNNQTRHSSEVATVFPTMKNFTEVDDLLESLEEILPFVEEIEKLATEVPLVTLATSIQSKRNEILTFLRDTELVFVSQYFQSLKVAYKALSSISSGVQLTQIVREIQDIQNDNFFKAIKPITKKIDDSLPDLQTLRSSTSLMKGTTDFSGIIELSSAIIYPAVVFGRAAESVERIRMLKTKLNFLKNLKSDVRTVAKEIENVPGPAEKEQMKEAWGFTRVYMTLSELIRITENFTNVENFDLLKNYSTTLKTMSTVMASLGDCRISNLSAMNQVITDLNNSTLDPVISDLKAFNQMNLDFSLLEAQPVSIAIDIILDLFYSGFQQLPETPGPYLEHWDRHFNPNLNEKVHARPFKQTAGGGSVEVISVKRSNFASLLALMLVMLGVIVVIIIIAYCYMKQQNPLQQNDEDQMC